MGIRAVYVDIDHTLIDGVTLNLLAVTFLKKRKITLMFFVRLMYWYLRYKMNLLNEFKSVLKHSLDMTEAWEIEPTNAIIKECFDEQIKPRFYVEMLRRLREHHENGDKIYFVSSTITPVADLLLEYIGFGEALVTQTEIKDGVYTGSIVGDVCFGNAKIERIKEHCKAIDIDLDRSYAYSDHISDVPMLELVGNAVVVNPGRQLSAVAKERDWEILNLTEVLGNEK